MAHSTAPASTDHGDTAVKGVIEHVDPATLLADTNVRSDLHLDPDFLASIKELGVLIPIVAVRTHDGGLRVRFGYRRTAAAIEAPLPTVPVMVAADERTDDAGQVERLLGQWAENEHRTGLTPAERVGVISQLAAFGISPAQIAKRTHTPRGEVKAALAVAESDIATGALGRYGQDFLTLDQAAALTEFEDNPEHLKALVASAKTGQFDHVAQRLRDDRAEAARRAALTEALRAQGVTVIDPPQTGDTTRPLTSLCDQDGQPLDDEAHRTCPGHVAYLRETYDYLDPTTGQPPTAEAPAAEHNDQSGDEIDAYEDTLVWGAYLTTRYACTDPTTHGHHNRHNAGHSGANPGGKLLTADMTDQEREHARAERRDVIDSNKAWASAQTVRLDWLRRFCQRKSTPKGSGTFLAAALAADGHMLGDAAGRELAADLFGLARPAHGRIDAFAGVLTTSTDQRAQVIALGLVLAAYEARTDRDDWRHPRPHTARYLNFLQPNGYTLSPVEQRACGQPGKSRDDQ